MNPVKIGRVVWPSPLGVGAGLVKNGMMLLDYATRASSIEIGSITRYLLPGNSGQTVWKHVSEKSLRHNAGMPNYGAEHLALDLVKIQDQVVVPWGINVAVSPGITNSQEAAIDIRETVGILLASGVEPDWITLNVASPDTADPVSMLSEPIRVEQLIVSIQSELSRYDNPPLWLKVGPGMHNDRLSQLAALAIKTGTEAMIVGNTMPDRAGGGWCGKTVSAPSNSALWFLKQVVGDHLPLIGTGGVMTGKDVRHKLALGATAVQTVSSFLIRGREAAREIEQEFSITA